MNKICKKIISLGLVLSSSFTAINLTAPVYGEENTKEEIAYLNDIAKVKLLKDLDVSLISDKKDMVKLDIKKALEVRNSISDELYKINENSGSENSGSENSDDENSDGEILDSNSLNVEDENISTDASNQESASSHVENNTADDKKQTSDKSENKKVEVVSNESSTESYSGGYGQLSSDEYKLFVSIVDVEASAEPYEAKLAVANVILNRLRYGWGSSIRDIVYARGQFPPAHNGVLAKRISSGPWSSESEVAVKNALDGVNNIGTAQSFNMYFGQKISGKTQIIGETIFYNFR